MDFDAQAVTTVVELIAVVLAGFGNGLAPLTHDNGEEPCPKALLPIANKPMIDYPLSWIEQSGVRDVLLICPTSHRAAISHHIHSDSTSSSFSSLRIDLQIFDETEDIAVGTSAILQHFAHRIKHDFIILPCDFIPPSGLSLVKILNKFRTESLSDGAIATACWFERVSEKSSSSDDWEVHTPMPIVWDDRSSTLLYVDSAEDADRDDEDFNLRLSLLSRYPRARLSSKFQDSHVYVCRREVLDVLHRKSHLVSFREDFIPWLVKPQYQRTKHEKYGHVLAPFTNMPNQAVALSHSTLRIHAAKTSRIAQLLSAMASPDEDDPDKQMASTSLRVGFVLHRANDGYAARANSLQSFLDLNRQMLSSPNYAYSPPMDPDRRSLIDVKAQISPDSMVGESTRIEERTNVKRSVIGKHCVIGKMAKVVGCVVLDHCVIGDGAKLENCLLGKNTKIGSKAELSRCVTQGGYEVDAGETLKNETLEVSDWAAAVAESSDGSENSDRDDRDTDSDK